jgi:hypothetical protein
MKRTVFVGALLMASAVDAGAQAAAPAPPASALEGVRRLYLEAVSSERAIPRGVAEVERLRGATRDAHAQATLAAYHGAFTTLRAKHGSWPPDRLRHLRQGLAVMDSVVAAHPHHAEARYLRLMSCYYLPRVLGRGWSVRDDFAALARLLPSVRGDYPPELYRAIVRFVMEHGRPAPAQRAALQAALDAADG